MKGSTPPAVTEAPKGKAVSDRGDDAKPPLILYGYRFSVYTRIVQIVLHEKQRTAYRRVEVDPFSADLPASYLALHPFRRVPVLDHAGFVLYETSAITRYIDSAFDGPPLLPKDACAAARVAQTVAIADSYGYWPLVRQVFSHRVFRPRMGEAADEAEIAAGLAASHCVLRALEKLSAGGEVLDGTRITLADCHLAPMISYFSQAPEGADALSAYPSLARWWAAVSGRASMIATDPGQAI